MSNLEWFGPPITALTTSGLPLADTFSFGSIQCPGLCRLKSLNSPRGWDERQGNGQSGATLVPSGDPLKTIVFEIEVWEGSQWFAFKAFAANYLTTSARNLPGTKTPRALGILHPIVNAPPWNVLNVVVLDCTVSDPGPEDQPVYVVELTLKEYRPPVIVQGKPDQGIAPATQEQPTAKDALDVANIDWANQARDLITRLSRGAPGSSPSGNEP